MKVSWQAVSFANTPVHQYNRQSNILSQFIRHGTIWKNYIVIIVLYMSSPFSSLRDLLGEFLHHSIHQIFQRCQKKVWSSSHECEVSKKCHHQIEVRSHLCNTSTHISVSIVVPPQGQWVFLKDRVRGWHLPPLLSVMSRVSCRSFSNIRYYLLPVRRVHYGERSWVSLQTTWSQCAVIQDMLKHVSVWTRTPVASNHCEALGQKWQV